MKTLANTRDRTAIFQRIHSLEPNSPRQWGMMTPHQMLCHLDDSFRIGLRERTASPATGLLQRTVIKWAGLYLPTPWPHGVPTRPEVEQGRGGTAPGDFEQDKSRLSQTIARFCETPVGLNGACHPIFGPMKTNLWLRWGYLHADHHLRQFGL